MMKRFLSFLAVFMLLASSAGALKMSIWDRDMQTPLGSGESTGNKFNVHLVRDYSGPVVVIFAQTEEEKRSGTFPGLQNRYDGVLKNGQLTLMPEPSDKADKTDVRPAAAQPTPATSTTTTSSTEKSVGQTLAKLLQQFKLTVNTQTTGQTDPLQDRENDPSSAANASSNGNGTFKSLDLKGK